jgi:mRNA-degrading endonuclease toxin of MazEF toxin-antitoxin module
MGVSLTGIGCRTSGVVLCHQIRALDLQARGAKRVENVPDFILDDVMARVAAILEIE